MEKEGVSSVLIVFLVLGIIVGQSTAQKAGTLEKAICYAACFMGCNANPDTPAAYCALICIPRCFLPKSAAAGLNDTQYFCKLGCATALCSNLSTKENPGEKKVKSCVDGCSATCGKKN